jgi:hypothetical protein
MLYPLLVFYSSIVRFFSFAGMREKLWEYAARAIADRPYELNQRQKQQWLIR